MAPRRAIVREPGNSYASCLSCHPYRHTVDLAKAREQHQMYCRTLAELGLEILRLPRDDRHPDSCFVEDTAVVWKDKALVCRMGAPSRRGEELEVERILRDQDIRTQPARDPATVEGGDVIHLEDKLMSGLSERTNRDGILQMGTWLGVGVDIVEDPRMMHLKSHLTYLGHKTFVATRRFASHEAVSAYKVLVIPQEESYAADTLTIGDTVLMAEGRTRSHAMVRDAGFDVIPLNVSEFEKCDGALTCLSILF